MRLITFLMICFSILTLISTHTTTADYEITNGSTTENAWVVYSYFEFADNKWPAGWRTTGWYKIGPDDTLTLPVPENKKWVYIRVEDADGTEIKPGDHQTRDNFPFWIHPSKAFTVVEDNAGNFLKSNLSEQSLSQADLYEYGNGGSHTIGNQQRLPDLPAQEIYDKAIHSVVLILTDKASGSGVLIDKERRLVVTNQHVIDTAGRVDIVFPYRDRDGKLQKDVDFYLNNAKWLVNNKYATEGRVIAENAENDLAIVQLDWLPPTTREIQHDFSQNVEDSLKEGDKVHILGNPGGRLWNWTQGTFLRSRQVCLIEDDLEDDLLVGCLAMEGDAHGGNSGGPVLNGQGVLIGILTASDEETTSLAAPTRNIKALLDTLRPRYVFKIENPTRVTIHYQIKWSNNHDWKLQSVNSGKEWFHSWRGERVSQGYPKIRFDHIAGDQRVTYRTYLLETVLSFEKNSDDAPTYFFNFVSWNRLDLFRGVLAAPVLSMTAPTETALLSNYPNPFNPETWIPYKLAQSAEVRVSIYTTGGRLIRTLLLGHQPAGVYQSKSRAAYWDGKNEVGEPVASGVYFYTLTAGDFTATRKMLIAK